MEDVTGMVESAGICLQDLWNAYFRGPTDDMASCPPELQDLFEEIEARLFAALVLRHLGRLHWLERFRLEPLPFLVVAPLAQSEARLLVNRRTPHFGNQYWDAFGGPIGPGETTLHFLDWFDWEVFGRRQDQYYLVRIAAVSGHVEFVGRNALIERRSTHVFFDPSAG